MPVSQPRPETFLLPGEFHFGAAPGRVGTLLGSCVAATVWHPGHRCGGMCHILLPQRLRAAGTAPDGRYADEAIACFVLALRARRILPGTCEVKLFGGGNMFAGTRAGDSDVGRRNVEATRHALTAQGFRVMCEHVGGLQRRRLILDLSSGHVWLALPANETPHPRTQQ